MPDLVHRKYIKNLVEIKPYCLYSPEFSERMENLKILDVSENNIVEINLEQAPGLITLLIKNNSIRSIRDLHLGNSPKVWLSLTPGCIRPPSQGERISRFYLEPIAIYT